MQHHDDVYLGSMRDFAEKVGELLAGHTRDTPELAQMPGRLRARP